jgi:CrcB protein
MSFNNLLMVFVGSATGGTFRYLISGWIQQHNSTKIPLGTFIVNILGCFILGIILESILKNNHSDQFKLLLITGFCGGFTTFSAFSFENLELIKNGEYFMAFLYIVISVVLGILATWGGMLALK